MFCVRIDATDEHPFHAINFNAFTDCVTYFIPIKLIAGQNIEIQLSKSSFENGKIHFGALTHSA